MCGALGCGLYWVGGGAIVVDLGGGAVMASVSVRKVPLIVRTGEGGYMPCGECAKDAGSNCRTYNSTTAHNQ